MIGFNDIAAAGKLASHLYNVGLSKYTSANQEYRDFMQDINGLGKQLKAIEVEVKQFPSIQGHSHPIELPSLNIAINGIDDTLRRCDKLLNDNTCFEKDTFGFVKNIIWEAHVAEHVQALQTRLSFHMAKIQLIMEPLKIKIQKQIVQLMSACSGDVNEQLQQVKAQLSTLIQGLNLEEPRDNTQISLQVPYEVVERFEKAGSKFQPIKNYSIQQGLDAIVLHLEASTKSFKPATTEVAPKPPTFQYLNLLKCIWTLDQIKEKETYTDFCSEYLSEVYVRQLQRRIKQESLRFQADTRRLEAPTIDEMLAEKEEAFEIWLDLGIREAGPSLGEPTGLEMKILQVPIEGDMQGGRQEIMVFRLNENRLRIARISSGISGLNTKEESQEVDCQNMVLIPVYAYPKNPGSASCSVNWKSNPSDERTQNLIFTRLIDLHKFQAAITNFGVVEDQNSLCSLKAKSSWCDGRGSELGCKGRVQLWLHRRSPSSSISSDSLSPTTSPSSQRNSMFSKSTGSSSTKGWAPSYTVNSNRSSIIRVEESGAFLDKPIPARLIFFTNKLGRDGKEDLRFVSIIIDHNTYLDKSKCRCSTNDDTCTRLVLESKKKKLQVKTFRAKGSVEQGLGKWNIAAVGRPPGDPSVSNIGMTIEDTEANFVTIDLDSQESRKRLSDKVELVCKIMKSMVDQHHRDLIGVRSKNVHQEN